MRGAPRGPHSYASASAQEELIRGWARAEGHHLVGVVHDHAPGDLDALARRSGLFQALAERIDRRAAGLVVARLEVLATDVVLQEAILASVVDKGGDVFTCDQGRIERDDRLDRQRNVLRRAFGAFAQLDREVRAARVRTRHQRMAARGGYTGGAPAFGYRAEDQQLVIDTSEQAALTRIEELWRAGASLRAMARILSAEGHRPKRSDRWHPESLRRIIGRLPPRDGAG